MGLLVDGIIGPILETFGVVTVDENGEWKKPEKPEGDYQKKEKPERESLGTRIKEWSAKTLTPIRDRIKELTKNKAKEKYEKAVTEMREAALKELEEEGYSGNAFIKEATKNDPLGREWCDGVGSYEVSKKLRRISKMEAKTLLSAGNYSLWCHTWVPFESEIKKGVVYQVMHNDGAYGAMYDDYYVYDELGEEETCTEPPKNTMGKFAGYEPNPEMLKRAKEARIEDVRKYCPIIRRNLYDVKKDLDKAKELQKNLSETCKEILSDYNVKIEEQPHINTPKYSIEPVYTEIDEKTGETTIKKEDRELYEYLPKKDPNKFYVLDDFWDD